MTVSIGKAKGEMSVIKFGPEIQGDATMKYRLYHWTVNQLPDGSPGKPRVDLVKEGIIPAKGRLTKKLPVNERYLIMISNEYSPAIVTTKEHSLMAPFFVTMEAPKHIPMAAVPQRPRKKGVVNGVQHALRKPLRK